MRFVVKGGRLRTLMGLGNLAMGMALCATVHAQDQASTTKSKADADGRTADEVMPVILVRGKRTLNMDIRRNRDDIQPYVVFDAEQIAKSGAQTIEGFLQANLPMNAQQTTNPQLGPQVSPEGRIDLRGLGSDQTLILVDGRRLPSISTGDSFRQANLNGISISQIERIEILPATASGIYGGGATGGVINIILKRDYSGFDVEASYGNAFNGGVGQNRLGISGGFSLEEGKTRVLFSASHANSNLLLSTQRNFARRGAQQQLRNDPTDPSVMLGGANICSTEDGTTCSTQSLQLKSGASLGSAFTSIPAKYTGAASDGGAALTDKAGQLQFDRAGVPIWSAPETNTFTVNARREFSPGIEAYVDFARDHSRDVLSSPSQILQYVPASASVNPFQQDVLSYLTLPSEQTQRQSLTNTRVYAGAIARLPHQWSAVVDYGWLRSTSSSTNSTVLGAASPAADETLQAAVFRDLLASPLSNAESLLSLFKQSGDMGNTLKTLSLRLSGPVVDLPGGKLTATALLERRDETSDDSVNTSDTGGASTFRWTPEARRKVDSQYLELRAPVISARNDVPFANLLELMVSVRHDGYRTEYSGSSIEVDSASGPFPPQTATVNSFGSTSNTLGLRYAPTRDITLRASRGTGFLPPDLGQIRSSAPTLFPSFLISLLDLRDPKLGNALIPGPLTVLAGGSSSLRPEKSKSTSMGVILTPRIMPGLRVSVDYTDIRKTDEVSKLPLNFFIDSEDAFPGRIVRGPGSGGLPGPITQIDSTLFNVASSRLKAFDLQAEYTLTNDALGQLRLHAAATHTKELSRSTTPGVPAVDRAGFSDGPLKWRGNIGVDWSSDAWSAGWNAQYYGSYRTCQSTLSDFSCKQWEMWQGAGKVSSQLYHDAYVSYDFFAAGGILRGTDITFAVNNLFNNQGPTISSAIAYSVGATSYLDPRLRRYTLSVRKHF
ncbi:TonB-dependent receptor domain-containing protein [Roseateles cellulosilyticus]|uniref:TonB-dependent receptor n=1 Tax=Pelomonas cellulosilytica TaxID=2906762 RepID=A0ABS8XXH2_9BURK|nr:TonB-dependent receptor [Pelomonas sp. P8]MCE4556658.1 TonB-dependent receptor [Pelomonas sp. P8]